MSLCPHCGELDGSTALHMAACERLAALETGVSGAGDTTVDAMFDWIEARRYGAMYQNGRIALVTDETYAELFVHEGSLVDCFAAAVGFINANPLPACSSDCESCIAVGAKRVTS